jgi:hypothetical protein
MKLEKCIKKIEAERFLSDNNIAITWRISPGNDGRKFGSGHSRQNGILPKTKACKLYDLQAFLFFVNQYQMNNFSENEN